MVSIPIVQTLVAVILWGLTNLGLPGLLALMLVSTVGVPPLPSEVILAFAGFLVATGTFPLVPTVLTALAGAVLGAYVAYLIGRYARSILTRGPKGLRIDPKHLEWIDAWFARHGEGTVILTQLLPFVRAYVSYPAGAAKMDPGRFGVYTLIGVTPFTLALLYLGIFLRQRWQEILPWFNLLDDGIVAVLAVLVGYGALRWTGHVEGGWPPRWRARARASPPAREGDLAP